MATYQNKEHSSPESKLAEFRNAIKLNDFGSNKSRPPSYRSYMMAEAEKNKQFESALHVESAGKETANRTASKYPSTAEEILYEHVLSRRRQSSEKSREYEGDIVVDWCVAITKTLTVIFLIFMFMYTGFKWWSLGPHYAKNWDIPDPRLKHLGSVR